MRAALLSCAMSTGAPSSRITPGSRRSLSCAPVRLACFRWRRARTILIASAIPCINGIKHPGDLAGSQLAAGLCARCARARGPGVMILPLRRARASPLQEEISPYRKKSAALRVAGFVKITKPKSATPSPFTSPLTNEGKGLIAHWRPRACAPHSERL